MKTLGMVIDTFGYVTYFIDLLLWLEGVVIACL